MTEIEEAETNYLRKTFIKYHDNGDPFTKREIILFRRGAFKSLPVCFSNDLVHGSWWFTLGSFESVLFSLYPIFYGFKHFQTNELLGAWLFLIATLPFIPYFLVFFAFTELSFYFFLFVLSIILVLANYLFVVTCYPTKKRYVNKVLPIFSRFFGVKKWALRHFCNDRLVSTWIFFWLNLIMTIGSGVILLMAIYSSDTNQIFLWLSAVSCSLSFLIGSAYFVAGSYPEGKKFRYIVKHETIKIGNDVMNPMFVQSEGEV